MSFRVTVHVFDKLLNVVVTKSCQLIQEVHELCLCLESFFMSILTWCNTDRLLCYSKGRVNIVYLLESYHLNHTHVLFIATTVNYCQTVVLHFQIIFQPLEWMAAHYHYAITQLFQLTCLQTGPHCTVWNIRKPYGIKQTIVVIM